MILFFEGFGYSVAEIPLYSEGRIRPLSALSRTIEDDFLLVPGKKGGWLSLDEVRRSGEKNITRYEESVFSALSDVLHQGVRDEEKIRTLLRVGYQSLAGTPFLHAAGKKRFYPAFWQLELEAFFLRWPLLPWVLGLYGFSFFLFLFRLEKASRVFLIAFLLHTVWLGMRSLILWRPPVATMYETLVYVPWVAGAIAWVERLGSGQRTLLFIANGVILLLLGLIPFSGMPEGLENIQPVLDSQLWLTIHVLLVVGSYGAFALGSLLGHASLLGRKKNLQLTDATLTTLSIGIVFLIGGTCLGGVWAAQSWGRFWDWDPKEAWAFISSCVYLAAIHAYRYRWIGSQGLAAAAIGGFLVISFTWYGVNYLLGTGLHSYGFGTGGAGYYIAFLGGEILFLLGCWGRERIVA